MTCPRCKGDGVIEVNRFGGGGVDEDVMIECPECDGEGVVPDEEEKDLQDMMQQIHKNYPNLDYVNPEYRKYYGQIKKDGEE